ncbi:MAG: hypothetical protein RMK20_09755, partial [Verrucomicrobiales bacterium]|nr:hypothetical protein [Verrucomicrobiales bacterium]
MFEQLGDGALDVFQLVEFQVRVGNGEHVAGFALFVDEGAAAVANDLFLDLEDAFAFEHDGEDEGRREVARVVLLDELAQERLGGFAADGFGGRGRRFINALPVGDEAFALGGAVAELRLPAVVADIKPLQLAAFLEQERVIRGLVGEGATARFACRGARLDVPIVDGHVRVLSALWADYSPGAAAVQLPILPAQDAMQLNGTVFGGTPKTARETRALPFPV